MGRFLHRMATCHIDRPHYGKGLCILCYRSSPGCKANMKKHQASPKYKSYCSSLKRKAAIKEYKASPKGIAKRKAYDASPKGRAKHKAYDASPKGRAKHKAYRVATNYRAKQKAYYASPRVQNMYRVRALRVRYPELTETEIQEYACNNEIIKALKPKEKR